MGQFKFGYRVTSDRMSTELEFIDDDSLHISRPTLLIFGGNPTTSDSEAGRYARTLRNWLGDSCTEKDIDIISVVYNDGLPLKDETHYNYNYDYDALSDQVLLPLVIDNNGEKFSYETASKKLSRLTVFGHSAGAFVLDRIMARFQTKLAEMGYLENEIINLCQQIKFLAFSPYAMVNAPISSVYITPYYDYLGSFYKSLNYLNQRSNLQYTTSKFDLKKQFDSMENNFDNANALNQMLFNEIEKSGFFMGSDGQSSMVVAPAKLSKNNESDHGLIGIVCGPNNENSPLATSVGKKITKFIKYVLSDFTKNSIKNVEKNKTQKVDFMKLQDKCLDIFNANSKKAEK
jgi:hypothetical protein